MTKVTRLTIVEDGKSAYITLRGDDALVAMLKKDLKELRLLGLAVDETVPFSKRPDRCEAAEACLARINEALYAYMNDGVSPSDTNDD